MNRSDLIGRLTRDVELRKTESGNVRADFTIAINRIGAKENQQQADFIPCRVWNSQAENLAHYMSRGSLIAVEGTLRNDNYTDKDGNTKYSWYVLAQNIEYLSQKGGNKEEKTEDYGTSVKMDEIEISDEDLPF